MIRLSTRYVVPLSICLFVTLIPVVVHSYIRAQVEDCSNSWAFFPGPSHASLAERRRDDWMRDRFQSDQWHEGSFFRVGARFDVSIIRSYDPKRLYHRPENSLVEHAVVKSRKVESVQADSGSLPIHRAYYEDSDPAILAAYVLVYRSAPIADPYWSQLRAAPVELFLGRRPMTLFFIQAHGPRSSLPQMEQVEREWLLTSWQKYCSACIR